MDVQVVKADKILDPGEEVIVWKIGDYLLIKRINTKKVLDKISEIRKGLKAKNALLSDEEVLKTVKEARKEWKESL